jgi:hypothetical protein
MPACRSGSRSGLSRLLGRRSATASRWSSPRDGRRADTITAACQFWLWCRPLFTPLLLRLCWPPAASQMGAGPRRLWRSAPMACGSARGWWRRGNQLCTHSISSASCPTRRVDAVRCAVEIQRGIFDREPETPEERRIRFRIETGSHMTLRWREADSNSRSPCASQHLSIRDRTCPMQVLDTERQ